MVNNTMTNHPPAPELPTMQARSLEALSGVRNVRPIKATRDVFNLPS